jgi:hypothetical protein
MTLPTEDLAPDEPRGDLVTWMAPGALRLGAAGLATVALGAFALGLVAAMALLGASRHRFPAERPTVH